MRVQKKGALSHQNSFDLFANSNQKKFVESVSRVILFSRWLDR